MLLFIAIGWFLCGFTEVGGLTVWVCLVYCLCVAGSVCCVCFVGSLL